MWKFRLPRERLGFVQSETKQLFVCRTRGAEFGEDGVLRFLNLRDEFLARSDADAGKSSGDGGIRFVRFSLVCRFHVQCHF